MDYPYPYLQVLGPIQVFNTELEKPARSKYTCTEILAWIHTHPGLGSGPMRRALQCAEGTRRSNLCKLRQWLGTADDGTLYVPEALDGFIWLDGRVTSDWERFCVFIVGGVKSAPTHSLEGALDLIKGEIFAERLSQTYGWANGWIQEMHDTVAETARELANRCLTRGDFVGARAACATGLIAVPGRPELMAQRILIEHKAGDDSMATIYMVQANRWAQEHQIPLAACVIKAIQQVNEDIVFPDGSDPTRPSRESPHAGPTVVPTQTDDAQTEATTGDVPVPATTDDVQVPATTDDTGDTRFPPPAAEDDCDDTRD